MPRNVLIIPDKFKGTLTAHDAAEAIAKGWRKAHPEDRLHLLPMSDGGDGFGEIVSEVLGARKQSLRTVDAAGQPCQTHWWWVPASKTAVVESAKVIGLAMLPKGQHHPFTLDTWGLGEVLLAAAKKGARQCIAGIGGSATNDGGFGMARALGWKFLDSTGAEIDSWTGLSALKQIAPPAKPRLFSKCIVAVDVQNRFLGPRGATRVYGPQKGIRPGDFAPAEKALGRLNAIAARQFGRNFGKEPGTGAAGGLGFGFAAFLSAELRPGFAMYARYAGLEKALKKADLVITGEGSVDRSSLMGKGVGELASRCLELKIPCLALGGIVGAPGPLRKYFRLALGICPDLAGDSDARKRAAYWLARLAEIAGRKWKLEDGK